MNHTQDDLNPIPNTAEIAPQVAGAPDAPEVAQEAPATPDAFAALGLAPELLAAVRDLGYTAPTTVQQRAIPLALGTAGDTAGATYKDLMVSSQTGSGKTAAFLLPVLHTLIAMQHEAAEREKADWAAKVAAAQAAGEPAPKRPRRKNPTDPRNFKPAVPGALVLCPTRELAQQVAADAIELVRHVRGLRIANIVGGMPYNVQIARLQNANLVVATPGRLLDLQRSGQIKLDEVRFLVVDEADRMLDLGFADDLAEIHQLTASRQQTMMFSATFAPPIQQLAMRVMHDGGARVHKVEVATPQQRHTNITQALYWADGDLHKRRLLDHWLRDASIDQAIVFACTQVECEQLADDLQQNGFAAVSLHGALSQGLRNRRLNALRDGRVQILVATDVAARGIDVPSITHVINYGLPMKAEDYTHRIGRTGRAGRDGMAITIAEFRDRKRLASIEAHSRQPFKVQTIEGLEPTRHFPPITEQAPARKGGRGRPAGRFERGPRHGGGWSAERPGKAPARFEPRGPRSDFRGDFRSGDDFRSGPRADFRGTEGRGDFRSQAPRGPRFEGRFEGRPEGRFEARPEGRFEARFEGRPAPRFDKHAEARPGKAFAPRSGAPRPGKPAHAGAARGKPYSAKAR